MSSPLDAPGAPVSEAGFRGRVKLGDLIDAALAPASPEAHAGFVTDLAAVTRTEDAITAVADRFHAEGDRGRRVFLEWLARLRVRVPAAVLETVPPLLTDTTLPDEMRIRVAARALRSSRSPKDYLSRLAPALTAGLTPLAALARLRAVQGRLRRSHALDVLIARRERRLRLACPRCTSRLRLPEMALHLYEEHGLVIDGGRARRPSRVAKQLRRQYAAGRDTTLLDLAAQLSEPDALRAWAARAGATAGDVKPLAAAAGDCGNGLCPRCLTELPSSVEPLPAPLTLAGGRLTGDGYTVEIRGPDGLRTCTITTPAGVLRSGLDGRRAVGPRALGVVTAAAVLVAGIALRVPVTASLVVALAAYSAVRLLRAPLPPAAERVVDRAWINLVPRLSADADRFVTRLCRASTGRGDAETRARALRTVIDSAPGAAAAARFLQLDDAGRLGVDRVAGVSELVTAGLRGDEPLAFAEYVAEFFLVLDPRSEDIGRLRMLVLDSAFEAGYTPRGLADLWAACPRLRELTAGEPLSRLGLQHVVWSLREERPWETLAPAGTVFELARVAPTLSGRLLDEHPDLLLFHRPPPAVDEAFGWVLVTARGVVVGGNVVADPDAEIRIDGGRLIGSAALVFGPHRLALPRRPPAEFVTTLRRLLRVRTELLLPRLDAALAASPTHRQLGSLTRRCRCGADVLVGTGSVGRVFRAARLEG